MSCVSPGPDRPAVRARRCSCRREGTPCVSPGPDRRAVRARSRSCRREGSHAYQLVLAVLSTRPAVLLAQKRKCTTRPRNIRLVTLWCDILTLCAWAWGARADHAGQLLADEDEGRS